MADYLFSLDPSSKKYECPECHQKTFVVYLDQDGNPVDENRFGRCDRENNCAYQSHPLDDEKIKAGLKTEKTEKKAPPIIEQIFPADDLIERITKRTLTCTSNFHAYCNRLTIPNDHLLKWGVYSDDAKTIFLLRDNSGRVVNLKTFLYKSDGHRDKSYKAHSLTQPKTPLTPPKEKATAKKFLMCLFGAHLLSEDKSKTVVVVESEKTAAIASFFYNQFDWVACGSNNGLTLEKISPLDGRRVIWLNDSDHASRMRYESKDGEKKVFPSSIRHLMERGINFDVCDLWPEKNDGYDIADAIAEGVRPEIIPTLKPQPHTAPGVEHDDAFDYDLPAGVNFNDVKNDIRTYMHFEHKGRIYIVKKRRAHDEKGATFFCEAITNFTVRALGLISNEYDPARLIELQNIHGFRRVVRVPTTAFTSEGEFSSFIESVGNFQWDGTKSDLRKVRSRLYDTMITFDEVRVLGWQNGYLIFANGAYNGEFTPIDKYGFVKLGEKNLFIQPLSCITESSTEWEDEKRFIYRPRPDVKFKEWLLQFDQTYRERGRVVFAWILAALFRDFIYQRFKFFPHLFLFGPPGTGKSQLGWSMRALTFIGAKKPFNLMSGTDVSFFREMAQYINIPCWYDEFDSNMEWKRVEALKNAYDGAGHSKAIEKSETRSKKTPVHSACLISGQHLPVQDNALFKRVILLQFHRTEFTADEQSIFKDMQKMESAGLTHILAGLMKYRPLIEEKYNDEFDTVLADIMKDCATMKIEVEDRIMRNSCIILTAFKIISDKLGKKIPFNYLDLKSILMSLMKDQMKLITTANETSQFWEICEFLKREGKIKAGEDFVIDEKKTLKVLINHDEEILKEFPRMTEIILIRFSKIIPLYRENFKRQNLATVASMDKGSLMHYLTHSKSYIGLVKNVSFNDTRTSAHAFDNEVLRNSGVNLGDTGGPVVGTATGTAGGGVSTFFESKKDSDELPF